MKFRILFLCFLPWLMPAVVANSAENDGSRFWNTGRGYAPFRNATTDGIIIENTAPTPLIDSCRLQSPVNGFTLSFRVASLNGNPGKNYSYKDHDGKTRHRKNPSWGFFFDNEKGDRIWVTVSPEEAADPLSSSAALRVQAWHGKDSLPLFNQLIAKGLDTTTGDNIWRLSAEGDILTLSAGNRSMSRLAAIPLPSNSCHGFGFAAFPASKIRVTDIALTSGNPLETLQQAAHHDINTLDKYFSKSDDMIEGYWAIFDMNLEDKLLRQGGEYRLAIVKNGNAYDIIYLDGAKVNAGKWKPGMKKGVLIPTPFPDVYDLEWIDAEGHSMSKGIKAQSGEGNTLLIQFPYQSSSLRLRRVAKR